MENALLSMFNMIKMISLLQVVLFFLLAIFFNIKLKKVLTEYQNKVNGLGSRVDRQFNDYKDKAQAETEALKERIFKLEVALDLLSKKQ